MRRLALIIAVVGFLGLAGVGLASGVSVFTSACRALAGAGAIYVLVTLAGRIVIRIVADAIIAGRSRSTDQGRST